MRVPVFTYRVQSLSDIRLSQPGAAWQPGCEKMERERGKGEREEMRDREIKWRQRGEMETERDFLPLHILYFSPFPPFPLISSQFTAFVANLNKRILR